EVRFWAPCSDDCTNTCVVVEDEELCPLLVPIEGVLECDASSEEVKLPDADGNPVAVCVSNALLCRDVDGGMMCAGEPTPPCTDEDVECPEGLMCDEDSGNCLACLQDSDCEEGEYCNGSCITPCEDAEEDCTPW